MQTRHLEQYLAHNKYIIIASLPIRLGTCKLASVPAHQLSSLSLLPPPPHGSTWDGQNPVRPLTWFTPSAFLLTGSLEPTCVFHLGSHLHDGGDLLFLGGVYHHHCATGHTDHTAQLPQQVQTLSQEIWGKDGTACESGERDYSSQPSSSILEKSEGWARAHYSHTWKLF